MGGELKLWGASPARDCDAYVVLLHGGRPLSRQSDRFLNSALLRMVPFDSRLRVLIKQHDCRIGVGVLQYRVRGWNGDKRSPVADTLEMLDHLTDMYGSELPIVLMGHSMGGRTAVHVAGAHPNVRAVCALAPWWPQRDASTYLSTRHKVLAFHGTRDVITSSRGTETEVARLRARGLDARFESLPGTGHYLTNNAHALHHRACAWVFEQARLSFEP